jgi:uncharacterized membrane protein (UPF0127 family)
MLNSHAILHSNDTQHPLRVVVAAHFIARFKGLMFSRDLAQGVGARGEEGIYALLITPCSSVHTAFMRYPLDIVYLDNNGTVLQCVNHVKPWRASFCRPAKPSDGQRISKPIHTLELEAGGIAKLNLKTGDRLRHPLFNEPGLAVTDLYKPEQHQPLPHLLLPNQERHHEPS